MGTSFSVFEGTPSESDPTILTLLSLKKRGGGRRLNIAALLGV